MPIREIEIPDYPNQGTTFPEHKLAHDLLDNLTGVILGESSHNAFRLPNAINIAPMDDEGKWIKTQLDMNGKFCRIDLYGEANALSLDDNSQDFIASSHCLEHVPNLVGAFLEFARVLKDGGILFTIVPKRDARPEDANRPVSTLADFECAYENGWSADTVPPEIIEAGGGYREHTWVFTLASLKQILLYSAKGRDFEWEIIAEEETDSKVGNGHTLVARIHKKQQWPKKGSLGDVMLDVQRELIKDIVSQKIMEIS